MPVAPSRPTDASGTAVGAYAADVSPPPFVLIVEDDEGIGGGLLRALGGEGYAVEWCRTGTDALASKLTEVDVVLLDLGLPDMDGLDLCRSLRRELPHTPILMLTARGSETDIVVGLDAGADDYLVKPFRLAELFARLRAHTRRRPAVAADANTLAVGDVLVDIAARRVHVGGIETELRPKEFDLLVVLMRNAGKVLTRDDAMSQVWDEHWFGSTKTLDVHVASLRQRLGESGPEGSRISTLRGVGYRLELAIDGAT
jgi:DNA-binding response OmpR family regulator